MKAWFSVIVFSRIRRRVHDTSGIVYWLQTVFHSCDSTSVFIVGVSRVHAHSLPQKMARNKIKPLSHTAFLKIFRVVHEKKIKNALDTGYQHFKRSQNSSIFVLFRVMNTNIMGRPWDIGFY